MKPLRAGAPLIALSLTLLASPADAQMGRGRSISGGAPARSIPPSAMLPVPRRPSTVAPTPTFTPNPFRVPANGRSSPFDARSYTYAPRYAPRYDGRSRPLRAWGYPYGYPYGYGYGYGYGYYADTPIYTPGDVNAGAVAYPEDATAPDVTESVGRLFIDTEPATTQVLVDGSAVGTVADFRGVGMLLPEGVRHVELRAPGYETSNFDIDIFSSQPAVYRGDLAPVRPTAGPPAAPIRRGSDTFYLIPGCYLGNRPPSEVSLPPDCDLKKTRTIK